MIETIYVEESVASHFRVKAILERFANKDVIFCEHYGEVFNRKAQNFRLQKTKPALILAQKQNRFVLEAPAGYGIGGEKNYYFSHMMNCIYDCRYCFLQGMYRSAHYVLFVNFEDFMRDIENITKEQNGSSCHFFSGYDCDSLALEPFSFFAHEFVPLFANMPDALLELRTKSTQIRNLLKMPVVENVVVAYSLSPARIVDALEYKTPSLAKRLDAMEKLANAGWKLGVRFDPLIYHSDYQTDYRELIETVFERFSGDSIHSVSLGAFRLPEGFFRNIVKLYPDVPLFAGPLESQNGMMAYRRDLEMEMMRYCSDLILKYCPANRFFPCRYEYE